MLLAAVGHYLTADCVRVAHQLRAVLPQVYCAAGTCALIRDVRRRVSASHDEQIASSGQSGADLQRLLQKRVAGVARIFV